MQPEKLMANNSLPSSVRITEPEIAQIFVDLCESDHRGYSDQFEWLILEENKRRAAVKQSLLVESIEEDVERRR
jgi:hypothetical protein